MSEAAAILTELRRDLDEAIHLIVTAREFFASEQIGRCTCGLSEALERISKK